MRSLATTEGVDSKVQQEAAEIADRIEEKHRANTDLTTRIGEMLRARERHEKALEHAKEMVDVWTTKTEEISLKVRTLDDDIRKVEDELENEALLYDKAEDEKDAQHKKDEEEKEKKRKQDKEEQAEPQGGATAVKAASSASSEAGGGDMKMLQDMMMSMMTKMDRQQEAIDHLQKARVAKVTPPTERKRKPPAQLLPQDGEEVVMDVDAQAEEEEEAARTDAYGLDDDDDDLAPTEVVHAGGGGSSSSQGAGKAMAAFRKAGDQRK